MLVSDNGYFRRFVADCDEISLYEHEGNEYEYLTNVIDNSTWYATLETVEELTEGSEIIAEYLSNKLDDWSEINV